VYCSVLQCIVVCVAVCCSVLQCVVECVAVCCSVLQRVVEFVVECVEECVVECVAVSCLQQLARAPAHGLALVSRIDKILPLFCKRALQNRQNSAKQTSHLIDPTPYLTPFQNPKILKTPRIRRF